MLAEAFELAIASLDRGLAAPAEEAEQLTIDAISARFGQRSEARRAQKERALGHVMRVVRIEPEALREPR